MRWALPALLWLLAWPACADDLWDQLGPARIGATRTEIARQVSIRCGVGEQEGVCNPGAGGAGIFAGLPVTRVDLYFGQERLVRVRVSLSDRHYQALLSFLSTQFGASDDRSFLARGGMAAAEFEAGVHVWKHEGVSLVFEQFAGKIDRSGLTYGNDAAMAELVRAKTSYPRGARRDL